MTKRIKRTLKIPPRRPARVQFTIRLEGETCAAVRARAKEAGCGLTAWVEAALKAAL